GSRHRQAGARFVHLEPSRRGQRFAHEGDETDYQLTVRAMAGLRQIWPLRGIDAGHAAEMRYRAHISGFCPYSAPTGGALRARRMDVTSSRASWRTIKVDPLAVGEGCDECIDTLLAHSEHP